MKVLDTVSPGGLLLGQLALLVAIGILGFMFSFLLIQLERGIKKVLKQQGILAEFLLKQYEGNGKKEEVVPVKEEPVEKKEEAETPKKERTPAQKAAWAATLAKGRAKRVSKKEATP